MRNNDWLDVGADTRLIDKATDADLTRIRADDERLELVAAAQYDAGFEAGVLASEAGLGRYDG